MLAFLLYRQDHCISQRYRLVMGKENEGFSCIGFEVYICSSEDCVFVTGFVMVQVHLAAVSKVFVPPPLLLRNA